jgi:enoyl-CoA hydratase/carnithine racemase
MRFASRENAIVGQPEVGIGVPPGAGALQHLTRLLGRGRALEAVLTSADFDADLAERYGCVNRAITAKSAINAISLLAPADVRAEGVQQGMAELFEQGFQTRGATELGLGQALGELKAAD